MSWIAVLLVGIGVADLAHSMRPARVVNEAVGAAVAVAVGLTAGLTDLVDAVVLAVIALVVMLWGHLVTRGFGRGPAWPALALAGAALTIGILVSGRASATGGPFARWLDGVGLPVLRDLEPDRALLLLGLLLLQLSTGNVVVRLVLAVTGTVNPLLHGAPGDPELQLKGGRLLGPMERVFIVGLGLAGHLTAASIVIAAKGLLRFPELQSRSDQQRIHQLTEYFLVGSFASWLIALSSLVLLIG